MHAGLALSLALGCADCPSLRSAPLGKAQSRSAVDTKTLGVRALRTRRFDDAVRYLAEALSADPTAPELVESLTQALSSGGNPNLAVPILRSALSTDGSGNLIHFALAQCYQHLDQDDQAIQLLTESLSSGRPSPAWTFSLAFSLFREGQFVRAEDAFRSISDVEQMRPAVSFFIANCRFGEGDLTGSLQWYEAAIRSGTEAKIMALNAYYYNYGLALFRLERFEEASEAFFAASRLNQSDPLPPYFLGRSQAERGEKQDAIDIFLKLTQAHPEFSPAYYQLGILYKSAGDLDRAKKAFARVGEIKHAEMDDASLLKRLRIGDGQKTYPRESQP